MLKTLYLHENLEWGEPDDKYNMQFILLTNKWNNTHLRFIQPVRFEEDWKKSRDLIAFIDKN